MTNFAAAIKALCDSEVNFVVVGAYAAVAQGSAQVTRDLDICYERTPANLERLASALKPHNPRLRGVPDDLPFSLDRHTLLQGMNFTLETDLGDIDLMGDLSGVGQYQEVVRDALSVPLHGISCQVASLDTIIRSKRAAGRSKDLLALPELEALKELRAALEKDEDADPEH